MEGKCIDLFPKYLIESHFLVENIIHLYKEEDLTTQYLYLKIIVDGLYPQLGLLRGWCPYKEEDITTQYLFLICLIHDVSF